MNDKPMKLDRIDLVDLDRIFDRYCPRPNPGEHRDYHCANLDRVITLALNWKHRENPFFKQASMGVLQQEPSEKMIQEEIAYHVTHLMEYTENSVTITKTAQNLFQKARQMMKNSK